MVEFGVDGGGEVGVGQVGGADSAWELPGVGFAEDAAAVFSGGAEADAEAVGCAADGPGCAVEEVGDVGGAAVSVVAEGGDFVAGPRAAVHCPGVIAAGFGHRVQVGVWVTGRRGHASPLMTAVTAASSTMNAFPGGT